MRARNATLLALALVIASAHPADAQEFASGGLPLACPAASRLLEFALPVLSPAPSLALAEVRWHGLPDLGTRSLAAGFGVGALRASLGASQTGDGEVGWTALAMGAGWVDRTGGAGLRVIARRDRTAPFAFDTSSEAWGIEAGAGGWIALDHAWQVWASAPSLWQDGAAPPLARALGGGATWKTEAMRAWLAVATAPAWAGASGPQMGGGAALRLGPAWLWAAGRDHPARPTLGLDLASRFGRVMFEAESHPVLGTTTRLAIAFERSEVP